MVKILVPSPRLYPTIVSAVRLTPPISLPHSCGGRSSCTEVSMLLVELLGITRQNPQENRSNDGGWNFNLQTPDIRNEVL